jgi:hypothetical protein
MLWSKSNKYWNKSNVAFVANVLDPRYERKNIELYLRQLYWNSNQVEVDKFNIVIKNMYQLYATTAPSSSKRRASMAALAAKLD